MNQSALKFGSLFICSSGRAGSTLTMRMLGTHPEMLVRNVFPFETRARQYYFAASRSGRKSPGLEAENYAGVNYLPFQGGDREGKEWAAEVSNLFADEHGGPYDWAMEFYRRVSAAQMATKAKWIVEKAIGVQLVTELLGLSSEARAIFLIRDPRDTFFSAMSFNRKSAHSEGFGEGRGKEVMFQNILSFWKHYQKMSAKYEGRVSSIRYEDLISSSAGTLRSVCEWLDVTATETQLSIMERVGKDRDSRVEDHSTTSSPQSSVGRWRDGAGAEDMELFRKYSSEISAMGYQLD